MVNSSLAQAYEEAVTKKLLIEEEALMKKSSKKNPHVGGAGNIHPSFPPQGAEQPAHMGSQSMSPAPMSGSGMYASGTGPMDGDEAY